MRLLSRHILRSLAAPFGWGVVALSGMLLLNQLSTLIDRFGGKGLPFTVMGEAILLALPALLTLTLPMAVLSSALYAYGQLAADLEMVAMYANGISVWRMARPALVAALGVTLINFLIFDQIVPRSNARFTTLQQDVMSKLPTLTLRPQVLNPLPNTQYILQAAEIEPVSGALRDVTIYDLSSYQGTRVIRASRGRMGEAPNRTDLLLTLFDGEIREVKSLEPGRFERTAFRTNRIQVFGVANLLERRQDRWERSDRELTGCELLAGIDSAAWYRQEGKLDRERLTRRDLRRLAGLPHLGPRAARPMPELAPRCVAYQPVERWFERLILGRVAPEAVPDAPAAPVDSPTTPAVRSPPAEAVRPPLPAVPLDTTVRADTTVKLDSTLSTDSTLARPVAASGQPPAGKMQPTDASPPAPLLDPATQEIARAPQDFLVPPEVAPAQQGLASTIVDVNSARYQDERNLRTTREFAVEYHKKFAIPLASFGFVLVAMALALKYPRSGIGLVIGGSLVIFLGFYVLLIGGENLANAGYISARVAMYAPLVIFTLLGVAAIASANREMGTARSSGILQALGEAVARLYRHDRPEAT